MNPRVFDHTMLKLASVIHALSRCLDFLILTTNILAIKLEYNFHTSNKICIEHGNSMSSAMNVRKA